MTARAGANTATAKRKRLGIASWYVLAALALLVVLALAFVTHMPLGPMYWDIEVYLDAAYRISIGQAPAVDFFAPAGPLDYYLFAAVAGIFPNGQPVLVASWSVLLVTLPLMAIFVAAVGREKPVVTLLVVIPFAVFSLLPFNTGVLYPYPGADGFGIYNRHGVQLVYVLVASLLSVRSQRVLGVLIALAMATMFAIKITAFLAAGLLCMVALVSGRVKILTAIASIVGFLALMAIVELTTGLVSAYLGDLATLVQMNEDDLVSRLVQSASRTAGIVLPAIALVALLAAAKTGRSRTDRSWMRRVVDHPATWLAAAAFAGIFYESQNTGSQDHIFLWPVVLFALTRTVSLARPATSAAIVFLAGCAILPILVSTSQNAFRAIGASVRQPALASENLKTMGAVTIRPDLEERANELRAHYLAFPEAMEDLAERNQTPSFLQESDLDFQIGHLQDVDRVVGELKRLEADGLSYGSVMVLGFTNPFPWLLEKDAPRTITIGAVPGRTVPDLSEATLEAVQDADVILEPRCPFTRDTLQLRDHYAPALEGREAVEITPCYRAWMRPETLATMPSPEG